MSKVGEELLQAVKEARAFVNGTANPTEYRITIPPEIDAKTMREKAGLTQEEFAEHFGFDLRLLKEWESGRLVPIDEDRETLENLYKNPALAQETSKK